MERREKETREVAKVRERRTLDKQKGALPTLEISDEDYRSLHMPCDALDELDDGKPG